MALRQLDSTETNSKRESVPLSDQVKRARYKAARSVAWQEERKLVNLETGELLSDDEGNCLTLADIAKGWYTQKGVKKQAVAMVKRVSRSEGFETRYKPVFLTLTVDAKRVENDIAAAWETVGKELNRFLTNLRQFTLKRYGAKVAYFWVLEAHPDAGKPHFGWPHYHLVILGMPYIAQEKLAAWWGMGFIKVKTLDGLGGIVRYMGKYMWKACELMTKGKRTLDELPDWWFYYRTFKRRRNGFSKFFQLPALDRLPSWLQKRVLEVADAEEVTKVERMIGGGWRVGWVGSAEDSFSCNIEYASLWQIV